MLNSFHVQVIRKQSAAIPLIVKQQNSHITLIMFGAENGVA